MLKLEACSENVIVLQLLLNITSVELDFSHKTFEKKKRKKQQHVAVDVVYDFLALSWIVKCLLWCREKQILCIM